MGYASGSQDARNQAQSGQQHGTDPFDPQEAEVVLVGCQLQQKAKNQLGPGIQVHYDGPSVVDSTSPMAVEATNYQQGTDDEVVGQRSYGDRYALAACYDTAGILYGHEVEENKHQ